jgi:hypothetical protein
MKIIVLAEGLAHSAETVESIADFRSLLSECVEKRTEAMKRIEEIPCARNTFSITGVKALTEDIIEVF